MSYGLNELSGLSGDAKKIIFANKSKIGRLEERISVLEGIVQSVADDRDSYAEQLAEAEGERDRARGIAVALEQDGAMAHRNLVILADAVLAEIDHNMTVYSKALAVKQIAEEF